MRNIQIYSVGNRNYALKVGVLKKKVGVKISAVYRENQPIILGMAGGSLMILICWKYVATVGSDILKICFHPTTTHWSVHKVEKGLNYPELSLSLPPRRLSQGSSLCSWFQKKFIYAASRLTGALRFARGLNENPSVSHFTAYGVEHSKFVQAILQFWI